MTSAPEPVCEHLAPVLAYLRSRHVGIESTVQDPNGWETVVVDSFFYKQEIETRFALPDSVTWSYADPHYGEGNSLLCAACRSALQSRFDAADPWRTIGTGK